MTNRAADRDLILEAMAAYVQAVDGDVEKISEVFDEETVWVTNLGTFTGADDVANAVANHLMESTPETRPRHLVANAAIKVGGDEATAVSDWYLVRPGLPWTITASGRYYDRLRRKQGRWVFAERDIQYLPVPKESG
jgi:3-phenylpropionate/cinnamic acid dioxygenase small subunit